MSGEEIIRLTRDALSPHDGRDVRQIDSVNRSLIITDDEGKVWVLRAVLALSDPKEAAA